MKEIPMSIDLYYNTQVYFAKNILPGLPNDDRKWKNEYKEWLKEQGCTVKPHSNSLIKNSLGVSPGYDVFEFLQEKDAIMFMLRWS
jgi:hypothetical protein